MVNLISFLGLCIVAIPVAVADGTVMPGHASVNSNPQEISSGGSAEPKFGRELDLFLLGTVVRETGKPIAIIQVGETGRQKLYHEDDEVNGGRLTNIQDDHVTLIFAGHEVELRLAGNPSQAGNVARDDHYLIQPRLRKGVSGFWRIHRDLLDELSRGGELKHHARPSGQQGLVVEKVSPDGLFHVLGLEEGDVILNINGRIPSGTQSIADEIANADMDPAMLRLEVEREGRMDAVYFEVAP